MEGAAPGVVLGSAFKRPHYAAQVQDFLQNRATPEEVQRVQRCMELIKDAAGLPEDISTTTMSRSSAAQLKPRPATTLSYGHKQHQQQQQQLRQSTTTDTDTSVSDSISTSSNSWLYTTTAAAQRRALSAHAPRPFSAQPIASVPCGTSPLAPTKPNRPGSAATLPAHRPDPKPHGSSSMQHSPARIGASAQPASPPAAPEFSSGFKSVNITTCQAMHGLKDLYPDLWAATVPICRPDAAPNKNFISEWGQSLQQGAGEAWKPYLATTQQLTNLQVAKPTDEFAVRADEALIGWVAKQQTHYAELLTPQAAAAVSAMLDGPPGTATATAATAGTTAAAATSGSSSGLSLSQRKELLAALRQLAAVVQPDRDKSISHTHHCKQTTVEQPSTTALLKEQTRIRTMGFPRKVSIKGFRPLSSITVAAAASVHSDTAPVSGTASQLHPAIAHGGRRVLSASAATAGIGNTSGDNSSGSNQKKPCASEMIDTQKSRVPLKWAASSLVPPCSTYTAAHGTHPGQTPQMFRTKFREVNVGMGHVDQHMYPPGSCVYPVEALYLQLPAKHRPQPLDVKTTYRSSFAATAQAVAA